MVSMRSYLWQYIESVESALKDTKSEEYQNSPVAIYVGQLKEILEAPYDVEAELEDLLFYGFNRERSIVERKPPKPEKVKKVKKK